MMKTGMRFWLSITLSVIITPMIIMVSATAPSPLQVGFDKCLQDDESNDTLEFNSFTGDYRYTRCSDGLTLTGRGKISRAWCSLKLEDLSRISASLIDCPISPQGRGTATIKFIPSGPTCFINDSNITNNTCSCPALAAYAPYWYIDNRTDSFLEIKNNLESSIVVAPTLTLITGQTVQLNPVTIAPLATESLLLNSQVQFRLPGSGEPRWGDGSRPNSLLGSAQLTLTSPEGTDANAFSAWVVIKNLVEHLGLVTPFKTPEGTINTVLEGLWWLPYPNTQAYFALQNASRAPIEVQMELFSDGQVVKTKTLEIEASALQLINIGDELKPNIPPALGGIRFSYETRLGQVLPGHILGRGMLIQEQLGFSPSLMTHESLSDVLVVPENFKPELQSPAAYFGALRNLISESDAYVHPHLLLRNISKRSLTVQGAIYGKRCGTSGCNDAELQLNPVTLQPESTVHIDLEKQRQASRDKIADGVAGLRLTHDGGPTDVVAELINVDQTGDVVLYDPVFNLLLHAPSRQTAISFNLGLGHRTFLILKNVTDRPQQARILLDYDNGKRRYDVALPEIPPQQVGIVNIKQLRDAKIPDKNGQTLPPDVEFGGAVILSNPGAFVSSDPTFADELPNLTEEGFKLRLPTVGIFGVSCPVAPSSPTPCRCDDGNPCNGREGCDPKTGNCVSGTNAALCTACTPAGRACDGSGGCLTGKALIPKICNQLRLNYTNPVILSCPPRIPCGVVTRFDVHSVSHSCDAIDLVGAILTEEVTNDHNCVSVDVTGGLMCPVVPGNLIHLPPFLPCQDFYSMCGTPSSFPIGTCTETITQKLFVDGCHAETRTIRITIARGPFGFCTGVVERN